MLLNLSLLIYLSDLLVLVDTKKTRIKHLDIHRHLSRISKSNNAEPVIMKINSQ